MTKKISRSILILADGVRYDRLKSLADEGKLPTVSKLFCEDGSFIKASTVFPSTTGPAYLPFLTGSTPTECNIPGIRWLDKENFGKGGSIFKQHRSYVGLESYLINSDIPKSVRTIFEISNGAYSIFNPITRGAGKRNLTRIMRIWYWYYSHLTDFWKTADEAALNKLISAFDRNDLKFVFVVFPGVDEYSHLSSPFSDAVTNRYLWIDHALSRIMAELKKRNIYDDTALWLVSDHGLSATHTHFCVNEFLDKKGLPPFYYPMIFNRTGKLSASMVSGNGMTHVYLKGDQGWQGHLTKKQIEQKFPILMDDLVLEDAVDLVICRGEKGVAEVVSKKGRAKIFLQGDLINYEIVGSDPFGYSDFPAQMSKDDLLKLSIDTDYPDAIWQVVSILNSSKSGDIVISASPGFDLRLKHEHPEHKSSHGSLHREHMLVPICCNQKFNTTIARTVDVFPTVLNQLNIDLPFNLKGNSFIL